VTLVRPGSSHHTPAALEIFRDARIQRVNTGLGRSPLAPLHLRAQGMNRDGGVSRRAKRQASAIQEPFERVPARVLAPERRRAARFGKPALDDDLDLCLLGESQQGGPERLRRDIKKNDLREVDRSRRCRPRYEHPRRREDQCQRIAAPHCQDLRFQRLRGSILVCLP
jgi:hypothetical protein